MTLFTDCASSPAMRLHVASILWGFSLGGIAKYVEQLTAVERFQNVKMTHICIIGRQWPTDVTALDRMGAIKIEIRSRVDLSWLRKLVHELRKLNPDLVMTHGFNGHVALTLTRWVGGIYYPVVCSYHGEYHPSTFLRALIAPIYNWATAAFLRRTALAVLLVSEHSERYLLKRRVPRNHMIVIHNGVHDVEVTGDPRTELRREWKIGADDFVVMTASRLDPVKGLDIFLQAMAQVRLDHPGLRLVLIGSGQSEVALKALAEELGLHDAAVFPGYRSDVARCLKAADVFVLPSLMEYHSIALLEAMRAGLPIVATAVGGNTESIEDGREGIIVPASDAGALAMAVQSLIGDCAARQRLGAAARERFLREFTIDVTLERTARWLVDCARRSRTEAKV